MTFQSQQEKIKIETGIALVPDAFAHDITVKLSQMKILQFVLFAFPFSYFEKSKIIPYFRRPLIRKHEYSARLLRYKLKLLHEYLYLKSKI
jgi:hypothetical protein